jgi:hypothetical protein
MILAVSVSSCSTTASDGSSASALANVQTAVRATLMSSSFTLQGYVGESSDCAVARDSQMLRAVYQAPDRFESVYGGYGPDFAVGSTTYVKDGPEKWIAEKLVGQTANKDEGMWLSPLLGKSTVERTSATYVSKIDSVVLSRNNKGYNTFKGTISTLIEDGKVQSERIAGTLTDHRDGGPSSPLPECGFLTYGTYGKSPAIDVPSGADVIRCTPGSVVALGHTSSIRCPSS